MYKLFEKEITQVFGIELYNKLISYLTKIEKQKKLKDFV